MSTTITITVPLPRTMSNRRAQTGVIRSNRLNTIRCLRDGRYAFQVAWYHARKLTEGGTFTGTPDALVVMREHNARLDRIAAKAGA